VTTRELKAYFSLTVYLHACLCIHAYLHACKVAYFIYAHVHVHGHLGPKRGPLYRIGTNMGIRYPVEEGGILVLDALWGRGEVSQQPGMTFNVLFDFKFNLVI
jgi:hypothetical protein